MPTFLISYQKLMFNVKQIIEGHTIEKMIVFCNYLKIKAQKKCGTETKFFTLCSENCFSNIRKTTIFLQFLAKIVTTYFFLK